jgi:uncharacterized protein YukE
MSSYGDIRNWNPDILNSAATALSNRVNDLVEHQGDLYKARHPSGWTGKAADGASASCQQLLDRMEDLVAAATAVRRAIDDTADRVTSLKHRVAEADSAARYHGLSITDNGDIIPMYEICIPDDELEDVKSDLRRRIEKILDDAEEIDNHLAEILRRAADGKIPAGESVDSMHNAVQAGDRYRLDMSGGTFISGVELVEAGEDGKVSLRVFPDLKSRFEGLITTPAVALVSTADELHGLAKVQKVLNLGVDGSAFHAWNAWNEVKDHVKRAGLEEKDFDTDSMFQQFLCHWIWANKVPTEGGLLKESWNLEPDRPAVGSIGCAWNECNPE